MIDVEGVVRNVGFELRAVRELAGYSRANAVIAIREETGLDIGDRTLMAWELSQRPLTLERFFQLCATYGAAPAVVVASALARADASRCRECGR